MQINTVEMKKITKSTEAFCASDGYQGRTDATKNNKLFDPAKDKARKKDWISRHTLFIGDKRVFVPGCLGDRFFWMDAITGTLYDSHGICKTSDVMSLDVMRLCHDQEKAGKILMSAKSLDLGKRG